MMQTPSMIPRILILFCLVVTLATEQASAQRQMLHRELVHLRSGEHREWSDFPADAHGSEFAMTFQSRANETPQTLGLRRIDVKEGWQIELNGKRVGKLESDENDMEEAWELAPGTLLDGDNELRIAPNTDKTDDVYIGTIWLDSRPKSEIYQQAKLSLSATGENDAALPCRFTILNDSGSLALLGASSNEQLAVRTGVVYSSTGEAEVGVMPGTYTVYCGRGFEYSVSKVVVEIEAGAAEQCNFRLLREVDTKGLVACDTHIHTFEVSRHGDASLDERMVTLAGEGVELAIATDHNAHVDYGPYLQRLNVGQYVTAVIGNEVTTSNGHFNVFPVSKGAPLPDHQADNWDKLFASIFNTPDVKVAILNHPRDVHSGFTPFARENMIAATGKRLDDRTLQANGVELINSAALQSDPMVVFRDWLTLVNRGHLITACGTSDSHEVSRKIVGQGRTYLYAEDSAPGAIDVDEAVESLVAGRALVSMGLLTELVVNETAKSGELVTPEGDWISIEAIVQGPAWTKADTINLFLNGAPFFTDEVAVADRELAGRKVHAAWEMKKPSHDIYFVAVATGKSEVGLFWPIAKPYQPTSDTWNPYVWGSSGIVRIDADGDGKWTSPMQYAEQAVKSSDGDFAKLIKILSEHDHATAIFAAELWSDSGKSILTDEAQATLATAPASVQHGFRVYVESLRESLQSGQLP